MGLAKRWNRSFHSHAEAVAWATYVAQSYAMHGKDMADLMIRAERDRQRAESKS